MPDQRFPKTYRLCTSSQFDAVFEHRCSVADENLVIYCRNNELPHSRIGLVVSRKVGNAVKRNRWKRLLRDAFRRERCELPVGFDFVFIPRAKIEPNYESLCNSLRQLTARLERKYKRDQR